MSSLFAGWLQVRPKVFACIPAKCGSQSLKKAAFGVNRLAQILELREKRLAKNQFDIGPFTPWEVARLEGRKVLGVREPVDRFSALWRDKCLNVNKTKHVIIRQVGGMSPEELIAFVESGPFFDSHWFPQSAYLVPGAEVVRNDRILEHLGLESIRINSRPPTDDAMPAERIRAHYRDDVALWGRACKSMSNG